MVARWRCLTSIGVGWGLGSFGGAALDEPPSPIALGGLELFLETVDGFRAIVMKRFGQYNSLIPTKIS